MHEIAHGLGPAFARTSAGKVSIREAIGPIYGGLEEAKADVVGMFGLKWLVDHGALPKEKLEEYYASYVARNFPHGPLRRRRSPRPGRDDGVQLSLGARRDQAADRRDVYAIDYANMPRALADLAKELLEIEATGDRERAENWFKKYDAMPAELQAVA